MTSSKDEQIKLLVNELELINKFVVGQELLEKAWLIVTISNL